MLKTILTTACIIAAGVGIYRVANKSKKTLTYHEILDESLNRASAFLAQDEVKGDIVVAKLITLKRIREGQVAFNLIRRYNDQTTTTTLLSVTFDILICPKEKQVELDSKNEIIIKNFLE